MIYNLLLVKNNYLGLKHCCLLDSTMYLEQKCCLYQPKPKQIMCHYYFEEHLFDKLLLQYTYKYSNLMAKKQSKQDFDQHLMKLTQSKIQELQEYCNPLCKLQDICNNYYQNYKMLEQGSHCYSYIVDLSKQIQQIRSKKQPFSRIKHLQISAFVIFIIKKIYFLTNFVKDYFLVICLFFPQMIYYQKRFQLYKNSTMKNVNVHPDQQEIFLGYASKQSLSAQQKNFEASFIGGQPIWLFDPQQSLTCQKCYKKIKPTKKQQKMIEHQQVQQKMEESQKKSSQNNKQYTNYELTFIMQMYCPFQADHCYHRILYFFYCEHCKKNYKVFRQQANINYVPPQYNQKKVKHLFKSAVQKSYEFETSQYSKKELIKLINKIKAQVHEEIIQEAEDENSEQDESLCQEMNNIQIPQELQQDKNPQNQELIKQQNIRSSLDVKKDQNFEIYKKIMVDLNQPQLLYVSPPIPYNTTPINHKHSCQQCGAPYKLQVQLTQQILMIGKSKQLAMMEWGSLFVFTCAASCQTKTNIKIQQLVMQIQHDAVKEEQVKQLKKKNKKRKKQQKRKSKSKSRSKSQSEQQQTKTLQNKKQQQGDWD